MFSLGEFCIGPDLLITLSGQSLQLRPSQGLRAAEALLRASTRQMMREEAAKIPIGPLATLPKRGARKVS